MFNQLPTIIMIFVVTYAEKLTDFPQNHVGSVFGPNKGPMCHQPKIGYDCNTAAIYQIYDYKLAGWFYHKLFRSCRPFYTANVTDVCPGNQDLPLTKELCEDQCGEPCKTSFGIDGICMMEEYCHLKEPASANPRPCSAYNVKCCPRSVPSKAKIATKESHIQKLVSRKKSQKAKTKLRKASENKELPIAFDCYD